MQKDLGETLHLTPSTITRLIEKLELKQLVTKRLEGKQAYLNPTPKGLALQKEITESWEQLHRQYDNILTEEETAQFIAITGKLLKSLTKDF
jgi:DNA-binding MarR family transcriptional regulator